MIKIAIYSREMHVKPLVGREKTVTLIFNCRLDPDWHYHLIEDFSSLFRHREIDAACPPSAASPAKEEMPSAAALRISSGISGNIATQPETWKPPIQTGKPARRNGMARSTARGNWFDWTPTRPISARPPARWIIRTIPSGLTRRLVSS
jgi:hypothetical protein